MDSAPTPAKVSDDKPPQPERLDAQTARIKLISRLWNAMLFTVGCFIIIPISIAGFDAAAKTNMDELPWAAFTVVSLVLLGFVNIGLVGGTMANWADVLKLRLLHVEAIARGDLEPPEAQDNPATPPHDFAPPVSPDGRPYQ